ncbi:unnamed protein product [Closterium sp. Naga37s-1]|nr:unnamed protein product [Closterium sp. Naga37s-1]
MTLPVDNWTMPEIGALDFDPIIAALSAVYSDDGSPASLAALAKERPEALKALSELLAFHMATSALDAAAIAAQFTADAGNLTTVNGQGLWINYNASQSAALLNAYSPTQRALMSEGVLVADDDTTDGNDGTLEWSEEEQQQLAGKVTRWMNRMVPGLTLSGSKYLAWLNAYEDAQEEGSDTMWEQAGSDMNVARVVWADVMESAGMVVHGVDGVLFPRLRDNPYNNTNMTSNGTAANGTSDGKANGSSYAYGSGRADGSPASSRDSSGGSSSKGDISSSSTVPTAGTAATGTPGNTCQSICMSYICRL